MPSNAAVDEWFVAQVLPLEGELAGYFRRACSSRSEIDDLRQEVFARVYEAARSGLPPAARPFVFAVARNLVIDRMRRARIVAIDMLADLDALNAAAEDAAADRVLVGRQELRRVIEAVQALPARCREIVRLRKIEGLSQRETARRLGVSEHTVEKQVAKGVKRLAATLAAEAGTQTVSSAKARKERRHERTR